MAWRLIFFVSIFAVLRAQGGKAIVVSGVTTDNVVVKEAIDPSNTATALANSHKKRKKIMRKKKRFFFF